MSKMLKKLTSDLNMLNQAKQVMNKKLEQQYATLGKMKHNTNELKQQIKLNESGIQNITNIIERISATRTFVLAVDKKLRTEDGIGLDGYTEKDANIHIQSFKIRMLKGKRDMQEDTVPSTDTNCFDAFYCNIKFDTYHGVVEFLHFYMSD